MGTDFSISNTSENHIQFGREKKEEKTVVTKWTKSPFLFQLYYSSV